MSGQLATRIVPARPWGHQLAFWGRVALQRVARPMSSGWCLSDASESPAEPTHPAGNDVPSPKRGAFPSRASDAEQAPEYIPDSESEGGPAETEPGTPADDAGHEEA